MSCDMRLFEFSGAPRTATTWVQRACVACYLPAGSKSEIHMPPEGKNDRLWVSTVRHPVVWLQSYWTNIFPGKVSVRSVDAFADLPGETFYEFVENYLETMPGGIGRMFESYRAGSYLRVEDLPQCWMELMETLRVPSVFRQRCLKIPWMNGSARKKQKPKWIPSLREAVIAAEKEMVEHFNYTEWDHATHHSYPR